MQPVKDAKRTVKAVLNDFADWPDFAEPGLCKAFDFKPDGCHLLHTCPGCGRFGGIGVGFGPEKQPHLWLLTTGKQDDPTTWMLSPSIHCIGCCGWHGHLKDGVFVSC